MTNQTQEKPRKLISFEEMFAAQLGAVLTGLRKKQKLPQIHVTRQLGIASSYLSEIESGKKIPTIIFLNKICIEYSIKLSQLFLEVEKWNTKKK